MRADTPILVCAYTNNQHDLAGDITADPRKSRFTKAMEVAEGCMVKILDNGDIVFTQILYVFDLFLILVDNQKSVYQ